MAKTTHVTVHQEVPLEMKGIEINVWEEGVKGGRLVITKATVKWFAPHAKKPTWSGSWEEFAKLFKVGTAKCDHCGFTNEVALKQPKHICAHCGRSFKIEW